MSKELKISINQLSELSGLAVTEIESKVCDCDLLYGKICDYHLSSKKEFSLDEWESMICDCDVMYGYCCGNHDVINNTKRLLESNINLKPKVKVYKLRKQSCI
jgi:hypothetical protein